MVSTVIWIGRIQWHVHFFSNFDWEYHFWANLVQKIKNVSLRWNLILKLVQICRIQWCCSLLWFSAGNTLLGQFGPKNQNCQLNVKLGTKNNLNKQNSLAVFTFFDFDQKCPFWANLVQDVEIFSLKWKLIPRLVRIWWIQWCCSHFSFSTGNALLGQNWSKLSIFTV